MPSERKDRIRADKVLWFLRLCKTRSLAIECCKAGNIRIEDSKIKAARELRIGGVFEWRKNEERKLFRLINIPERRLSAKEVSFYLENCTPAEWIEQNEMQKSQRMPRREKGTGRPTKKEMRMIEKLFS